ncbi:hypothetical protein WJX77_009053 [Trebouxia sp. C0004]
MDAKHRKLIRSVIKQVHPDLFAKHLQEQLQNTQALKLLNNYVDRLANGKPLIQQKLRFWTFNSDHLSTVEVTLPASGNLAALFHAFGLISEEDASTYQCAGPGAAGLVDVEFLAWLASVASQATQSAERHQALSTKAEALAADIEKQFKLRNIIPTAGTSLSLSNLERHIDALKLLEQCLTEVCCHQQDMLKGLCIFLHHPDSASMFESKSHVEDNGDLLLVADQNTIRDELLQLDMKAAHQRTQLSHLWHEQVKDTAAALTDMLGTNDVWFWSSQQAQKQEFVQWAGRVLEHRESYQDTEMQQRHSFNLLVHCDLSSRTLEFDKSNGILQVTTDCRPEQLLKYLQGEAATAASIAANAHADSRKEEQALLDAAGEALGAKYVMRMCSRHQQPKINQALQQLIQNAEAVKQSFDLSGIVVAIDDYYEVWGSGDISIPWNFSAQDLKPQLLKLLGSRSSNLKAPSANNDTNISARMCSRQWCQHMWQQSRMATDSAEWFEDVVYHQTDHTMRFKQFSSYDEHACADTKTARSQTDICNCSLVHNTQACAGRQGSADVASI